MADHPRISGESNQHTQTGMYNNRQQLPLDFLNDNLWFNHTVPANFMPSLQHTLCQGWEPRKTSLSANLAGFCAVILHLPRHKPYRMIGCACLSVKAVLSGMMEASYTVTLTIRFSWNQNIQDTVGQMLVSLSLWSFYQSPGHPEKKPTFWIKTFTNWLNRLCGSFQACSRFILSSYAVTTSR